MSQSIEEQIEPMIDTIGLYDVLSAIAGICADKADHIEVSYNDVALATRWRRHSTQINLLAEYLSES